MSPTGILSRRLLVLGLTAASAACATGAPSPSSPTPSLIEAMGPLTRLVGQWRGHGRGEPGDSVVERTYMPVLNGRFIEVRNRSRYAPKLKNPTGETHDDLGYLSFDRARSRFIFRQFHGEGFVNHYVTTGFQGDRLIMESEAIENIPAGFRARETYRFLGVDAFEEIFEIAEPDGAFSVYSQNLLKRM